MKNTGWDAYQIFLAVARHGGLTGAAQVSGLSPATISRRMLELEREMARPLFARSQAGYTLTGDGEALFDQLLDMEAASRAIEIWKADVSAPALVRIAAGTWGAWFLGRNFSDLRTDRDDFRLDFFIAERRASLAHREADIGIRAFVPEEANLASIKTGPVAYAVYRARTARAGNVNSFIAVAEEEAISAYLQWPHRHAGADIAVTVNRPRSLRDLILAGAGAGVLPCFVGDADMRLQRVGGEIAELRHDQWIVMNNDDRHRREIRAVADRMTKLLKSHGDLFAGKRPAVAV